MKRHLSFLASDSLQGRRFGTEINGLEIAAQYLAETSREIGLKPASNGYFQMVDIVKTLPGEEMIQITNLDSKVQFESASVIPLWSGTSKKFLENSEFIMAGFGYRDTTGYDDFIGIDLEGKIVVVAQGSPESFKKGTNTGWNNRTERSKIEHISEKKPSAIIIITNPQDKNKNTFNQISRWLNRERYALNPDGGEGDEIPVLLATSELPDKIFGKNGRYEKYLKSISVEMEPDTYLFPGKRMNIRTGKKIEKVDAKNVVGFVEGIDPELKNEYVVFMAHYDHLGMDSNGDVFNGADDNGSGTVTLLEVAEAFACMEKRPKRSVVFLWVTAEEVGLLGSEYYTENPIFPLVKTVACINIDMAGRVYEPRDSVWQRSPKMVKDFDGLFTLTNDIWPELSDICDSSCKELGLVPDNSLPSYFLRSSDHYHFHNKGVPILNLATGYHADYHKVSDELSKINFDKMKRVADLCFLVGWEIANLGNIRYVKGM